MVHAFTLALVYALILQSSYLLHAAASGWAARRNVGVDPATSVGAAVAASIGMALLVDAVTAGLSPGWRSHAWLRPAGWLAGAVALVVALVLFEGGRTGRIWRAMAANAPGLIVSGVSPAPLAPFVSGVLLAVLAGLLAPPPLVVDWLPLACLALLAVGLAQQPRGRATSTVIGAWLAGASVGALELVLEPIAHSLLVGLATLVTVRLWALRRARAGRA